jgi:DNA-binding CsgD family transcriptional regulator
MLCSAARFEHLSYADTAAFEAWVSNVDVHTTRDGIFEFSRRLGVRLGECALLDDEHEYRVLTLHRLPASKVGLIRVYELPPFDEEDAAHLAQFANVIAAVAEARDLSRDRGYEAAALRAVGSGPGSLFIVDIEHGNVLWSNDDSRTPLFERQLVSVSKQVLTARAHGVPPLAPPIIEDALLVRLAWLDDLTGRGAKLAACRIQTIGDASHPMGMLSERERHIAQLLVDGYSAVNVASIAGIAENTVRTHIKRIYRKFGINNRSELMQLIDARSPHDEHASQRRESGTIPALGARNATKKHSG